MWLFLTQANRHLSLLHTVQRIRHTLEELVCMHTGTPWSEVIPATMADDMYFWSMDHHETSQRMVTVYALYIRTDHNLMHSLDFSLLSLLPSTTGCFAG